FETSYDEVPLDQMLAEAEAIFIGDVISITPAKWNQDSGQYWYEEGKLALPFHEIEIATTQVLFDSIGIGKDVVITVLGASPVGSMDRAIEITGDVAHSLQAGDEAIFFVVERELAWQNETRS